MLIILGIIINLGIQFLAAGEVDFFRILEILGIVGLIMIVLEAALELKLERDKIIPITKALVVALVGLLISTWITAVILEYFIEGMDTLRAWIYATPLSILSSAIIIPSVNELRKDKKEFHIYESTFSDILGIILFYFLTGHLEHEEESIIGGLASYSLTILLTVVLSIIFSYLIVIIFQNIKSSVKLFLLIAVLLLLYALGKKMHLSSLIIILTFGLVIANMQLFFQGGLNKFLDHKKAHDIYNGLHVITLETAFVVRTFFFVIFGITITFSSLSDWTVIGISMLLLFVVYIVRYVILRLSIGDDIIPQLYIAPRGLITILLFYAIPKEAEVAAFSQGILLFIIIGTSLIMTFSMIYDKKRSISAIKKASELPVEVIKWKLPEQPK
jgi:NhaP-type Na+/H+ or K+/H+ antiporter